MKIAIDKNSIDALKKKDNEYIYIIDDEDINELLNLNVRCVDKSYIKDLFVDINLTDYDIDSIRKTSIDISNWYELPDKKDYKIGIIIPNYNYEHTVEKCIGSILNQTYRNFQIVFIDDMSTDDSVKKVRCMASRIFPDDKITIVELKQKRLNGGARNEGYLYLDDDVDYVWYVDSDDWLKDEYVLENINRKLQKKPDVLFVGMASYKGDKEETCFIPEYKDKYEALQGWSGSCGKVIKKSLATRQECLYKEGTLKEDKNQHCRICIYMKSFDLLKEPVYVWNQTNYKSVTTVRTKNILWETSTIRHYADALELAMSVKGQDEKVDEILEERIKLCKQEIEEKGDKQY